MTRREYEWEAVRVVGKFEGAFEDDPESELEGWSWDTWVWCLHCYRLQQVETVRMTRNWLLLCSFSDCNGTGMDLWDCDDGQNEGMFPPIGERESGQVIPLH